MKYIILLYLTMTLLYSDEFDIFDLVDQKESIFEDEKSFFDIEAKLNYQINEYSKDDKIFFLNIKKDTKNYLFDMRLIVHEDTQNILIKESYYKNSFLKNNHYEIGRMNIKEGVASGFNPTDYFKSNTAVTLSSDPKEKKDNRLGSISIRNTAFLDYFTLKAIYSPKISTGDTNILSNKQYIGLQLNNTNNQNRASLYVTYNEFKDISSSVVLHYNDDNLNLGINFTYTNSNFIFYLESSTKKGKNDISKAITKLDSHLLIYESFLKKENYISQASFGVTHTSSFDIVTTLEYIYNDGGLNKKEWDSWFKLSTQSSLFTQQLGTIRYELNKNNLILSKESVFLLSRASDIVTNLDANLLIWLNPYDMSSLTQLGVEYALSDTIQTNLYLKNYTGNTNTEYGSIQNNYEVLFESKYFF